MNDTETGKLTDNIVLFARALRRAGLPIGPAIVVDAVHAINITGLERRDDVFWTLHAIFVKKREHRALFSEAFEIFWRSQALRDKMLAMMLPVSPLTTEQQKPKAAHARAAKALSERKQQRHGTQQKDIEIDARLTLSEHEILRAKDFEQMSTEEITEAKQAIANLSLPIDKIVTRRLIAARRGSAIDPRRTFSTSLRFGGKLIVPQFRAPKTTPPPIVALCDISGSMSQYTRIFLHFLHGLMDQYRHVHAFLFATRLTNISRQLRLKDPDEALIACSTHVQDWDGGTRIAPSLRNFNRQWARRVLSGGAIVLLISDGLERDDKDMLRDEMKRLHRSCRRLIWLNPLLRFNQFKAKAEGIRLMLPFVDEFRPIHSLDALQDLCLALEKGKSQEFEPRKWLEMT